MRILEMVSSIQTGRIFSDEILYPDISKKKKKNRVVTYWAAIAWGIQLLFNSRIQRITGMKGPWPACLL